MSYGNNNSLYKSSLDCKFKAFIQDIKKDFIQVVKRELNSNKRNFIFEDALEYRNKSDKKIHSLLVEHHDFIKDKLNENSYLKYIKSYKKGKKLRNDYFVHDLITLQKYYRKIDDDPNYSGLYYDNWIEYIMYMLLKFNGDEYNDSKMDKIFNVTRRDNREYNPLTKTSRVLRGYLPKSLNLVQYDISRANPTFIDIELGINNREKDVYSVIKKKKFNTLLNLHKGVEGISIEKVRKQLEPIYGDLVTKVITDERFAEKGRLFRDLAKYESEYIQKFVEANKLTNWIRLHDAVFVMADAEISETRFGQVQFKKSLVEYPEEKNHKKTFYTLDNSGKAHTSPSSYKNFFERENIIRVCDIENDSLVIFKQSKKIIDPFHHKNNTASFLKKHIIEFEGEKIEKIENAIAKDSKNIHHEAYLLLDGIALKYYFDGKNDFYISFKTNVNSISDNSEITKIDYEKINGFFPKHKTQMINFKPNRSLSIGEFERFISMVSVSKDVLTEKLTEEESNTFIQFKNMIGYMCHTYKNPSFNPAIILSDMFADGINRDGGRGKTLVTSALKYVHNVMVKGGNEFDTSYKHRFADLNKSVRIYVIDDVPPTFNYDALYTNISGDLSRELKHSSASTLTFSESPKILITTNWNVVYDENANSTNRRFLEFKFTNFFNKNKTPSDVFSHNLFTDWDDDEWNRFYMFIFDCVQGFLRYGLVSPNYDKKKDNFEAYFSKDAVLDEFERIFNTINTNVEGFTVHDFLRVYKDKFNPIQSNEIFNHNNLKKKINVYIDYHELKFKYKKSERRWYNEREYPLSSDLDNSDVPF